MATTTKDRPLYKKFSIDLKRAMRSELVEREDEIDIFVLALAAKTHAYFLGEPGIAKSMLVEVGMSHVGGLTDDDYFHMLFMKSSTKEDVFGPLMLSLLKQDRLKYQPNGFLPVAKFFFGDEFWKGNAAIQNALLWALNERKYRNDGEIIDLPLWSAFIASNEQPESNELWAIYDRFPLRTKVKPIREQSNRINMFKLALQGPGVAGPIVTWEEIEKAHEEVKAVIVPGEVLEALSTLHEKLMEKNIFPSDRRLVQCLKIIQAAAWLEGCAEAEPHHLHVLQWVLWSDVKEIPEVTELCLQVSNPIDIEIIKVIEDLQGLDVEIAQVKADGGDEDMRERAGSEIYEKIDASKAQLIDIKERLGKKKAGKMHQAVDQITNTTARLLVGVFGSDPAKIQKGLDAFRKEMEGDDDGDDEE